MIDIDKEEGPIRQHLLGRLQDPEQEQFEERFITDPEFREVALIVEGELIDDYVAGLLSPAERDYFAEHYLKTATYREDLQFTEALRDYAIESEAQEPAAVKARPRIPLWRRIINLFFGNRWVRVGVLVVVLLFVMIAVLSLRGKWFLRDPRAALDAEITLLNKRPFRNEGSFVVSLTETIRRAPQGSNRVIIPEGARVVEVQCHVGAQPYVSYQASLRVGGFEIAKVYGLPAEPLNDGHLVRLRIPAKLLTPEDYLITVSGVTVDGHEEDVADYFIRVVKQSGANSFQP